MFFRFLCLITYFKKNQISFRQLWYLLVREESESGKNNDKQSIVADEKLTKEKAA